MSISTNAVTIPPNSDLLAFDGVYIVNKTAELTTFNRFSKEILSDSVADINFNTHYAKSDAGIILRFKTKSTNIKINFSLLDGGMDGPTYDWTKWLGFGIFQNGKFDKMDNDTVVHITSKHPGEAVVYEITMPSFLDVGLKNLILDAEQSLLPIEKETGKPQYVAIGNSITHGVGQLNEAFSTYPFKLARKAGWELHSFAVGGARVSPGVATMFAKEKVDIITILYGGNDWRDNDIVAFKNRYTTILKNIRKDHPKTTIYCIAQITRTNVPDRKYSLTDFRNVVINLVDSLKSAGDKNIYLIHGDKLTIPEDLGTDGIHLNRTGADKFADSLYKYIDVDAINNSTDIIINSNSFSVNNKNRNLVHFSNNLNGITLYSNQYISKAEVKIFNADGSKLDGLKLQNIEQGFTILNFNNMAPLSKGVYFISLITPNREFNDKIIIK